MGFHVLQKYLGAAIGAALLLFFSVTGANAQEKVPDEWRLGALFAFSGPVAFLGQETYRGAEIATQIINEQGGVLGSPVVWEKADATSPAEARSEAERLANSGIKLVFGTNSSGLAVTASQVLERNRVIFWEPGSAAEEITTRGFKYTFRTVPNGAKWANTLVDFAVKEVAASLGKNKDTVRIAVKHEDGAFGSSIASHIVARLKEYGIEPIAVESYSARATDLSSLVLKLKDVEPDIILSMDYPNDAILFARQSQELGLKTRAIMGWAGVASPTFRKEIGEYADGMMSINMPTDLDPSFLTEEARKARMEFRERYKKEKGFYPTPFAAVGFDGAWVLLKYVLPKAGSLDPDAIREAAMALDVPEGALTMGWGVKFSGPNEYGDHLGQNMRSFVGVTQWQDGKPVLVWPERVASGDLRRP